LLFEGVSTETESSLAYHLQLKWNYRNTIHRPKRRVMHSVKCWAVALFISSVMFASSGRARADLIGQTLQIEFNPGTQPFQHQTHTVVVPSTGVTANFDLNWVYGDIFAITVNGSSITIKEINTQTQFIWDPNDHFTITELGGSHSIAGATLANSSFPGFTPSDVSFTGNSVTLHTPSGGLLSNGNSITLDVQTIPEPASLALFGLAFLAAAGCSVWRRRTSVALS
jgi:hypothetical protein